MGFKFNPITGTLDLTGSSSGGAVNLVGQDLDENNILVGDASDESAAVDTSVVGDILVDSVNGANIKAGVILNADVNASAAIDASKLANGTVSNTEFQYINSLTSNAQDQLNDIVADVSDNTADIADLVTLTGVPVNSVNLGSFSGTIISNNVTIKSALQELETFVEAIPSPFYYAGLWAASSNTPTLADGIGDSGAVYYVTDSGTVDFGSGPQIFNAGDKVAYNGTTWDKWDMTDAVASVFGRIGAVTAQNGDYNTSQVTENTNLYFTDERAQDAIGTILTDSASIDFTYNDAGPTISAAVLPAGVDHDQLLNFVANEHVDHTTVQIATAANTSGLAGGGTIAATRNLSVDINGTTAETSADNADKVLIYDNSATALKSMTRSNFLAGVALASPGDISEGSFASLANDTDNQVVTGFLHNPAVVRSFEAQVSVLVDATSDLYAIYDLMGVQRSSDWAMSQSYTGDSVPELEFNITALGQIRVSVGDVSGFSSGLIKFRSRTTSV